MKRDLGDEKCVLPKREGGIRAAAGGGGSGVGGLRTWLGMKDPRIVRASRAFGGKDRHSKVNTIKGLRDRRVRLSVQTAIQLYDLQDRLGLSQPSKVVDWLISVTQDEIDKLPPLPMPASGVFPTMEEETSNHPSTPADQHPPQQSPQQVLLPFATKWKQPAGGFYNRANVVDVQEQFQDHEAHRGILQTINPSMFSGATTGASPVGFLSNNNGSGGGCTYSSASILPPYSYHHHHHHHHHRTGFLQPLMPVGSQVTWSSSATAASAGTTTVASMFQPYNYIDFSDSKQMSEHLHVAPPPTTSHAAISSSSSPSPSPSPFALFYPSASPSMMPFPSEHLLKALSLPKPPSQ